MYSPLTRNFSIFASETLPSWQCSGTMMMGHFLRSRIVLILIFFSSIFAASSPPLLWSTFSNPQKDLFALLKLLVLELVGLQNLLINSITCNSGERVSVLIFLAGSAWSSNPPAGCSRVLFTFLVDSCNLISWLMHCDSLVLPRKQFSISVRSDMVTLSTPYSEIFYKQLVTLPMRNQRYSQREPTVYCFFVRGETQAVGCPRGTRTSFSKSSCLSFSRTALPSVQANRRRSNGSIREVYLDMFKSINRPPYPPYTLQLQRMNQPLRETNPNLPLNSPKPPLKLKPLALLPPIDELLTASLTGIDFGDCVCGTVHERKLGLILLSTQEQPRIIGMRIVFEDRSLSDLQEYIYGVRKESSYEYFDQYKFKGMQKGVYNFVVGVKTPFMPEYQVKGRLEIVLEGTRNVIAIPLHQVPKLPEIKCSRQLVNAEGVRLLKIGVIRSKGKKEVKVAFKCTENLSVNLQAELVGLQQGEGEVEVKPKNVQVGGKGIFLLSFATNAPPGTENVVYSIRKILVLRVKDTKLHFHFPLEVTFYPAAQNEASSVE